jgi:hypothetical protein
MGRVYKKQLIRIPVNHSCAVHATTEMAAKKPHLTFPQLRSIYKKFVKFVVFIVVFVMLPVSFVYIATAGRTFTLPPGLVEVLRFNRPENMNTNLNHLKCTMSKQERGDMINLLKGIDSVLRRHKVTHCLCYGSLWGLLRKGDAIPWDHTADFCLLERDLKHIDNDLFFKDFLDLDMILHYDPHFGQYTIDFGRAKARLVLFKDWSNKLGWLMYRRMGTWIKFWNWQHETFPRFLMEPPLKKGKFMGLDLPVPREGFEIQKYLYPNSWWVEIVPFECQNDQKMFF